MGFGMYGYGQGYLGQGPMLLIVLVQDAYLTANQFFFVPAGSHWCAVPTVGRFFLVPVRDPEFMR